MERSHLIKLLYCLHRRPELTLQEFQDHWLERHSDFGRANPQVLRYVQYHTLADDPVHRALAQAGEGHEPAASYDGMAVAWFENSQTLQESMRSDNVAAALEDEKRFIDHSRSTAVLCDEHVIVEPEAPAPIVLVECLARRSEIDRKFFSERWLKHAHIGREANSRGMLQGYIQNHALAEGDARVSELEELGTGGEWDGIVTAYFHSVAVAKQLFADPLASEESFADEREFIDHTKGLYMLTRRHLIKDVVR